MSADIVGNLIAKGVKSTVTDYSITRSEALRIIKLLCGVYYTRSGEYLLDGSFHIFCKTYNFCFNDIEFKFVPHGNISAKSKV